MYEQKTSGHPSVQSTDPIILNPECENEGVPAEHAQNRDGTYDVEVRGLG